MNTSIGAVIVTHNNATTIRDCITSLKKNGVSTISIVDNASTDDTEAKLKDSGLTIIKNSTNRGFGAAANQGAKSIQSDFILFINPDANLTSSLAPVLNIFTTNPKVGIIGLALQDAQGNPELHSSGAEPTPWNLITRKLLPSKKSMDWVSGAAFIIRRPLWQQLQGFDESFFMYWEDVDLCHRARQAGYAITIASQPIVTHQRGGSTTDQTQKTKFYDASADRYIKKHYPLVIWGIFRYLRRLYRFWEPQAY